MRVRCTPASELAELLDTLAERPPQGRANLRIASSEPSDAHSKQEVNKFTIVQRTHAPFASLLS